MSNLERDPRELTCGGAATAARPEPVRDLLPGREVVLGGTRGMTVTRTLPNRDRRMVGPWCFVDHYGPAELTMRVPPHPHTGLQTVSWLVRGEIRHRDSVGSDQLFTAGELALMTAGRGIAHAEESALSTLHGAQLWVALPSSRRHVDPTFEHHATLPRLTLDGATVTVIMGTLGEVTSPATIHSPLVGASVSIEGAATLPKLNPLFEYAAIALTGPVEVDGVGLEPGPLLYLGRGRSSLELRSTAPAQLLLLGGEPFEEEIVMWWNFIGRSHDEVSRYREEWMSHTAFGTVHGYDGDPLPAPALPSMPLKPRGRER